MKTLNLSFEDKQFEALKSKKNSTENWQNYLLRLVGNKEPTENHPQTGSTTTEESKKLLFEGSKE